MCIRDRCYVLCIVVSCPVVQRWCITVTSLRSSYKVGYIPRRRRVHLRWPGLWYGSQCHVNCSTAYHNSTSTNHWYIRDYEFSSQPFSLNYSRPRCVITFADGVFAPVFFLSFWLLTWSVKKLWMIFHEICARNDLWIILDIEGALDRNPVTRFSSVQTLPPNHKFRGPHSEKYCVVAL